VKPFNQFKDKREPDIINQVVSLLQFVKELIVFAKVNKEYLSSITLQETLTIRQIFDAANKLGPISNIVRVQCTKLSDAYSRRFMLGDEMTSIIEAIGLKRGHWNKCPNGHFYVIGECGGAMEISKCPDCKADIGG